MKEKNIMVQSLYVMSDCRDMSFNEKYFVLTKIIKIFKDKKREKVKVETHLLIHTIYINIYLHTHTYIYIYIYIR